MFEIIYSEDLKKKKLKKAYELVRHMERNKTCMMEIPERKEKRTERVFKQ